MNKDLIHFRKFGGSYQFVADSAECLKFIEALDASLWAAVSIPCEAFNCDKDFLAYLDDGSCGRINPSDVRAICRFVRDSLKDLSEIDGHGMIERKNLRTDTDNAKAVGRAAAATFAHAKRLELPAVASALKELKSTELKGDGKLRSEALDSKHLEIFNDIIKCLKIEAATVDEKSLDNFLDECTEYLHWRRGLSANKLLPPGRSMEMFESFKAVEEKIDHYFALCHLLQQDASNAVRFQYNSENPLPELDTDDPEAIDEYLKDAPLSAPDANAKLKFGAGHLNPAWRDDTLDFSDKFKLDTLDFAQWQDIKNEFAPYMSYLQDKKGAAVESLGADKIKKYLAANSEAVKYLRSLFAEDKSLQDKLSDMSALHKLLLCCRDLQRFINNFVSFAELFNKNNESMLQNGRVIIGGFNYDLTVKVPDPQLHKKLSAESNICTMYLKVEPPKPADSFFVASAVTAGTARDLYVGKRGIFIPPGNHRIMEAQISDLVLHPVSFSEAFALPFVKMREFFSSRFERFTSTRSKALESSIDKNISSAAAGQPLPQKASAGAWLLGGSVGVAAVGSSFAFLIKTLKDVSPQRVLMTLLVIALIFSLPLVISAVVKLRRRNLARFFEAALWAVNLRMRLSRRLGRLFTFRGRLPANSVRITPKREIITRRILLLILLALVLLMFYFSFLHKCR